MNWAHMMGHNQWAATSGSTQRREEMCRLGIYRVSYTQRHHMLETIWSSVHCFFYTDILIHIYAIYDSLPLHSVLIFNIFQR
jgi:hypothetical protein